MRDQADRPRTKPDDGLQRAAAFFDLDKTLMAGSSGMQFARVAAQQGIVSRRQLASWGVEHMRYRLRGTTDARTEEVLRAARELITGVEAKTIERMGPAVMTAILPRVFPEMLAEVHAHQDAGRPAFIVSAAGNDVVESLAQVLGMEGGIGTRYEVDGDGNYTGRFDGPFVYGPGKVEAMQSFAARHDIDLAASYAYSDSLSDLPMLRAVGNPVAVNPDRELARVARKEGWPILRFERPVRLRSRLPAPPRPAVAVTGALAAAAAAVLVWWLLHRRERDE
ncbi:MAG TPA: HAD-IB family hydrolase [Solirubrobacterales bacterium]|nr:HAD-IB family hydrolase [Solirubrobacterales bacterium]